MVVISFNSTHHAIKSEKILKDAGYELTVLPTPREITASCGISIAIDEDKIDEIVEHLNTKGIDYGGVYKIIKKDDHSREAQLIKEGK